MAEKQIRVGFIGAGRVAGALAPALSAAGYRVTAVASRRYASADRLAQTVPGCVAYESLQAVVEDCDVVFLTLPDPQIQRVAASLRWRQGVAAVHTSGVETLDALAPALSQGAETASLHPLQTFAGAGAELRACWFGLEAEGALAQRLKQIVADLGGDVVELRSADKGLYHASAVLASNYIVTLMSLAASLWQSFGVERGAALRALLPLLRGAVTNLEAKGLPAALTGPIARGHAASVERHLQALAGRHDAHLAIYRQLGLSTIELAEEAGLSGDAAVELRSLLSAAASRPAS